jgi:hypothetical protein
VHFVRVRADLSVVAPPAVLITEAGHQSDPSIA